MSWKPILGNLVKILTSGSKWRKSLGQKMDLRLLLCIWSTEKLKIHLEMRPSELELGFRNSSDWTFVMSAIGSFCQKPKGIWVFIITNNCCLILDESFFCSLQDMHITCMTKDVYLGKIWEDIAECIGLMSMSKVVSLLVRYAANLASVNLVREDKCAFGQNWGDGILL